MSSIYSKFTNIYSLSKTLRFELKPVGNTEKMLEENNVFRADKEREEAYIKTKPYLDRLHRTFIKEALEGQKLTGLEEYSVIYSKYQNDKKDKVMQNALESKKKELRKQVGFFFNLKAVEWSTKKFSHLELKKPKDVNQLLSEEQVFKILKELYGDEEATLLTNPETGEVSSIFDDWKGFTGYFNKFFETRRNFYKDDGTSTAVSTRIINQNLDRFLSNLSLWEGKIKDVIDITEVEKELGMEATEVFSVGFYNNCMLQEGIDRYNEFLGGIVKENGEKIRGVNEIINECRQKNKDKKLPFLRMLDKQILSEKEKFIDEIESDEEFLERLKEFYNAVEVKYDTLKELLTDFFNHPEKYNLREIYISKPAYNTISRMWTNNTVDWDLKLHDVLKENKELASSSKKEEITENFKDFISLEYIKKSLESLDNPTKFWKERYYEGEILTTNEEVSIWEEFLKIFRYEFESLFSRKVQKDGSEVLIEQGFYIFREELKNLLEDFKVNRDSKSVIKNYADEVLKIYQMSKYFAVEKKRTWREEYALDSQFYNHNNYGYKDKYYEGAYEQIVQPYNKIRNFLTKKPYSENKWKLNFENPTLADGWDKNKEQDNTTVILRKGDEYYLGIMVKNHNKLFSEENSSKYSCQGNDDYYEKLVYKQMADPKRDFPKGVFSEKGMKIYNPPQNVYEIKKKETFKTDNPHFSKSDLWTLVDFYKECIPLHPSWKLFDFNFSDTREYENINDFYKEVSDKSYKIWFEKIKEDYIESCNNEGKLYLFQIYNKDFSKYSKGRKNLHTKYFEEIFSKSNIENNFPVKLNGQAEIFFRPATDIKKLDVKKDKKGKEIVDKKRYAESKVLFHVPITLNRVATNTSSSKEFNTQINTLLADNPNVNIIGLDRGEKHLIYYSVINQAGKILKTDTFNIIGGVDYHAKLTERAEDRKKGRQDWNEIETIKDLKRGYISQVVKEIVNLCVEYNAIIVMEDLNMRFKQIRGGIEKSVYQQLEKALIEKLNYLVDKQETDSKKAGHLLNAYQLTAPFQTFQDMGKQTGIIFYTQAAYTSQVDPLTGWRKNIYLRYSNAKKAKEDILKFNAIKYNEGEKRFEFTYDIEQFSNPKNRKDLPNKREWTVCSNVERFRWNKTKNNNKGDYEHYADITTNLIELFDKYNINYKGNILEEIKGFETNGNEAFFRDLIFYFNLICQIRNTQRDKEGDENDFIFSPVEPFFDSRRASEFGGGPGNGDENGAYNIARKGILILRKISDFYAKHKSLEGLQWKDLYVSAYDWDNFLVEE